MPEVSVIMPSYNHAQYLEEALEGLLNQTFKDFEVVIVEDGSQDGSLEIVQRYVKKHPNIFRLFTHEEHCNKGIPTSLNLGVRHACGKYLTFVASDDVLYPHAVETLYHHLTTLNNAEMVYGSAVVIDKEGQEIRREGWDVNEGGHHPLESLIINRNWPYSIQMIKREIFLSLGGFDEKIVLGDDWEFWMRFFSSHKAEFINKPLYKYRIHGCNVSIGEHRPFEATCAMILNLCEIVESKSREMGGQINTQRIMGLLRLQQAAMMYHLERTEDASKKIIQLARENYFRIFSEETYRLLNRSYSKRFIHFFLNVLKKANYATPRLLSFSILSDIYEKEALEAFNQKKYGRTLDGVWKSFFYDRRKIKKFFLHKIAWLSFYKKIKALSLKPHALDREQ